MKLKDLVSKLAAKPNQEDEVQMVVFKTDDGTIICMELTGDKTMKIVEALTEKK